MVADGRTINGRTSADHEPVELSGVLGSGKVYRAAVLDAFSRRIVGWSIADHMGTELVTDALGTAILRRYPSESIRTIPPWRIRIMPWLVLSRGIVGSLAVTGFFSGFLGLTSCYLRL